MPFLLLIVVIVIPLLSAPALAEDLMFTTCYGYDTMGRVESITHLDVAISTSCENATGRTLAYTFNSRNGHKTVTYDGLSIVSDTIYEEGGNAKQMVTTPFAHGDNQLGEVTVDRSYDALNRLQSLHVTLDGRSLHQATNLSYNDWGFIESLQRMDESLAVTQTYGYDTQGRLENFKIGDNHEVVYGYDADGNLTSRTALQVPDLDLNLPGLTAASYNDKNQNSNLSYDAAGRLTEDDDWIYTYNGLERVERVTELNTTEQWDIAQFRYDGDGERVREVHGNQVVYFIRDFEGRLLSQEIHSPKAGGGWYTQRKDFIYHNGEPLLTVRWIPGLPIPHRQYIFRDRMGSPAVRLDTFHTVSGGAGSGQFVPGLFEFSPYGHVMKAPLDNPSQVWNRKMVMQFTGHERDEDTLRDYMHARYYDKNYARFNRPDPVFDFEGPNNPGSYNLYAYTRGNPVNFIDPKGLKTVVIIISREKPWGVFPHAALFIDNSERPLLYDPGGSYQEEIGQHGSGDTISGNEADLSSFIKFHESRGSFVQTFTFETTGQEEAEIVKRLDEGHQGLNAGGFRKGQCTWGVCWALQGIGPFKDLGFYTLPSDLGEALKKRTSPSYRTRPPPPPKIPEPELWHRRGAGHYFLEK